jgi:acetylornithine deacetylase
MTMALKTIVDLGVPLKGDVIMEYTVDEELSGNGTVACIARGYRADGGICCETSSLHVQPASIGRIWFEISIRGKPAGIQRRWEGVSGIEKGFRIHEIVNEFERIRVEKHRHPLYPDSREALPCAVGVFNAGTYASAFPSSCLLKGSIATLPGEDSERVKQDFKNYILESTRGDPWLSDHPPEVLWKGYFAEPAEIPVDHPVCTIMVHNFELVTGRKALISGRMGAADTRHLIRYGETPTVIFGPGLTSQMHATDEWVNLDDVIVATKTIALSILDWCGYQT